MIKPDTKLWQILQTKNSASQIQQKFNTLKQYAQSCYPDHGDFPLKWLGDVISKIDELWYGQLLVKALTDVYGGLQLGVDEKEERVAGYVLEAHDGSSITLSMNKTLFIQLFQSQRDGGYHSGGLLCKERLVCFLHVLLHETVHLVLTMYDRIGFRVDIRDHGKDFNVIIKNLFGQTDSKHGLIPGYQQYHDLETIQKLVQQGSKVEVFVDGQWKKGIVEKKGYKWLNVKCNEKDMYRVHTGLIRIKNELKK